MRITLKLYATLTDYLPANRTGNKVELDVAEGTSVQAALDGFALPAKLTHLVLVDGAYVGPDDRAGRLLKDGEVLAVWPPVAGG